MLPVLVLSVLTGSSELTPVKLSARRLISRVDMWKHRGGMSCTCPGRLEVSRGIVEAKRVTSEQHKSSSMDLTDWNSCQLNSAPLIPTNCSRITSLLHLLLSPQQVQTSPMITLWAGTVRRLLITVWMTASTFGEACFLLKILPAEFAILLGLFFWAVICR